MIHSRGGGHDCGDHGMKLDLEKILREVEPYRERKARIDLKHASLLVIDMQNYFRRIIQPVLGNILRVITPKMYDEMLDEYYLERGWNERGIPNPETLERLGLHHLFTTSS
jgi:hypothetical protein